MVQRRFATGTIIILMVALGANPLFAYTATENFEGMLCLALFGIGLIPTARRFPTVLLIDLVATAQIAIAWLAAFNRPIVLAWMRGLGLG